MWYSIKKMIFYLGILFLLSMQSVQAKEYIVMTEDFAPYGYIENGALTGLSVEIVREIFKILQHPDDIKVFPWARAYYFIQNEPDRILFSMGRSPLTENLFSSGLGH